MLISKRNKRGQLGAFEIFFVMAMLFALAIFIVVLYYSWTQINQPIEDALNSAMPDGQTAFNLTTMSNRVDGGMTLFNVMYPFILLGLIIFALISVLKSDRT